MKSLICFVLAIIAFTACTGPIILEHQFKNPPAAYKPMPLWHLNGELTTENIRQQQMWDPHTGDINKNVSYEVITVHGERYTKLRLGLEPVKSIFFVSRKTNQECTFR